MAPRNKARQQAGNMRSRQQAKLNSQRAQKAPIQPAPRTGPRRQLPPSTQGQNRVGNSSQPWGDRSSGQRVQPVRVREVGRPQLPPSNTVPESRRLPGMQGPQPAPRPQRPGTSRPAAPSRMTAAQAKAAKAAQGTSSTTIRTGSPARPPRGRVAGALAGIAAGRTLGDAIGGAYRRAVGTEKAQQFGREGGYGRYTPRGSQEGGGMGGVGNIPPAEGRMNNTNVSKATEKAAPARPSVPTSSRSASPGSSKPSSSKSALPKPAAPAQSKNMEENFAAWTKANKVLAEKVKPNQAGYATIKKTLDELKIKDKGKK